MLSRKWILLGGVFSPEFGKLLFAQFLNHVQSLANQFLTNDFDEFVLLEGLARNIQRQIIRVNNTANEVQVIGHNVLEVVRDEHAPHVQLSRGIRRISVRFSETNRETYHTLMWSVRVPYLLKLSDGWTVGT